MTIEDLWLSHSHRVNADDSEKYMDEEDFKIAILEWESAKTVSRVELPVKPESTDIEKQEEIVTILYEFIDNMIKDYAYEDYKKGYSTHGILEAVGTALQKILKLDNLEVMEVQ